MADVYGVTHADVAAQIPGLFPTGFSGVTRPTSAQVTQWISVADTVVASKVREVTNLEPSVGDAATPLAKQYIIDWTLGMVMRAVYAGNDPEKVNDAVDGFAGPAKRLMEAIVDLGPQATGAAGPPPARIRGVDSAQVRDSFISDEDLGYGARGGTRLF